MKIFKNVRAYRYTGEVRSHDDFKAAAEQLAFNDASADSLLVEWSGFVPVLEGTPEQALKVGEWTFLNYLVESRIIPGGALRDAVAARVKEIENAEERKVYAREKSHIKDEILLAMIPRAFTKKKNTLAAIDHKGGMIYVDARSPGDAERVLSALRQGLESLPVRPVQSKSDSRLVMACWIQEGTAPTNLALGMRCTLTGQDSERVQITNSPAWADEVQAHLATGLLPSAIELAVYSDDREVASFILNDDLSLQRFQVADALIEEAYYDSCETAHDQALADATLMMNTLNQSYAVIMDSLGGELMPEPV